MGTAVAKRGSPFNRFYSPSEEIKQYMEFPEGTRIRIHDFPERFGRSICAEPIELNPRVGEFIERARGSDEKKIQIALELVRTIQAYRMAGKPLDYITFAAHLYLESKGDAEKFLDYARVGNYLYNRALANITGLLIDEEKIVKKGSTSSAYVCGGLIEKINNLLDEAEGPVTTVQIADKVSGKSLAKKKRKRLLGNIDCTLNILEVAGKACKLSVNSELVRVHEWLPMRLRETDLSIPESNNDYRLLCELHEKKTMRCSAISSCLTSKKFSSRVIVNLLEEGLVARRKVGKPSNYVYEPTGEARELLGRTFANGYLDEELRKRLLGKKVCGLTEFERQQMEKVVKYLKVFEWREAYGLSWRELGGEVGLSETTVGNYLCHEVMPDLLGRGPGAILATVNKLPDKVQKIWILRSLEKRGLLPSKKDGAAR